MSVDLHKPSHIWFFGALLPVISYGIGWEFTHIFPHVPFWVEGISPLTAYGLLFKAFDKVAWRWRIFRTIGIVTVPDIRGRWLGRQVSSYVTKNNKHLVSRAIMEVVQTFSEVRVHIYYQRWSSKISAAQFVQIDDVQTLVIMFEAERKVDYEESDNNTLRGVSKLVFMPDGTLQGTYFNAAGRHGEAQFKRTSYTLSHTFDAIVSKAPQSSLDHSL